MTAVNLANQILSLLTVLGQLIILAAVLEYLLNKNFLNPFRQKALGLAFLVALAAMSGSLFYSEIAGFDPCKLCWYQRILMYPQVLLLGLALWKREGKQIAPYSIFLSSVGALIAGYHYLLQLDLVPSLPCSAVGYSVSCSQRFVLQFGYITIPMMSLTVFLLIIFLMWAVRKEN